MVGRRRLPGGDMMINHPIPWYSLALFPEQIYVGTISARMVRKIWTQMVCNDAEKAPAYEWSERWDSLRRLSERQSSSQAELLKIGKALGEAYSTVREMEKLLNVSRKNSWRSSSRTKNYCDQRN